MIVATEAQRRQDGVPEDQQIRGHLHPRGHHASPCDLGVVLTIAMPQYRKWLLEQMPDPVAEANLRKPCDVDVAGSSKESDRSERETSD